MIKTIENRKRPRQRRWFSSALFSGGTTFADFLVFFVRLKFQEQSELKFASRTIPPKAESIDYPKVFKHELMSILVSRAGG